MKVLVSITKYELWIFNDLSSHISTETTGHICRYNSVADAMKVNEHSPKKIPGGRIKNYFLSFLLLVVNSTRLDTAEFLHKQSGPPPPPICMYI